MVSVHHKLSYKLKFRTAMDSKSSSTTVSNNFTLGKRKLSTPNTGEILMVILQRHKTYTETEKLKPGQEALTIWNLWQWLPLSCFNVQTSLMEKCQWSSKYQFLLLPEDTFLESCLNRLHIVFDSCIVTAEKLGGEGKFRKRINAERKSIAYRL